MGVFMGSESLNDFKDSDPMKHFKDSDPLKPETSSDPSSDPSTYGNANATYVPPLAAPFFPPPQAMTMYCFPFTM